jgi:hypothetical protein
MGTARIAPFANAVIPGRIQRLPPLDAHPESRDCPMCICASEVSIKPGLR